MSRIARLSCDLHQVVSTSEALSTPPQLSAPARSHTVCITPGGSAQQCRCGQTADSDVHYPCAGVHGHPALAQQPLEHEPVRQQGVPHQHCPDGGLCGPAERGRQALPQWLQGTHLLLLLHPFSPSIHVFCCALHGFCCLAE